MSDLYRLALALKASSQETISRLVLERSLNLSDYPDLFEFAQALLSPKSQVLFLASISAEQLQSIQKLISQEKLSREQVASLTEDLLIYKDSEGTPVVFSWLVERISQQPQTRSIQVVAENKIEEVQESIDRDCGIKAFEAIQAITEIIFDLDQNYVRDIGKGLLALPDLRRLADHLGKEKDFVRNIFELARAKGMVSSSLGHFQPLEKADGWLRLGQIQRWLELLAGLASLIGKAQIAEIVKNHKQNPRASLEANIQQSFPFAALAPNSRINRFSAMAEAIGLTSATLAASWFEPALTESRKKVEELLTPRLPQQQERVIIQADLSVVATGPLTAQAELGLRQFASLEAIGLAASYRLSAESINTGLESGLTEKEIRNTLEKLSGGSLPQPVEYLISEVSARFGRLKLLYHPNGVEIKTSDQILGKQIMMDSKLKNLGIKVLGESFVTGSSMDNVYFALKEAGYLAVRIDETGEVISANARHKRNLNDSMELELTRLRNQDLDKNVPAIANETERKIQLAIRSKSPLIVELLANGKAMSFTVEPIGLANGRLRAKDKKADIERTLPVSAITAIRIG